MNKHGVLLDDSTLRNPLANFCNPPFVKLFNTPLWFATLLINAKDNSSKAGVFTNITQRSLDCTLRSAPPTASGDINGELDPLA